MKYLIIISILALNILNLQTQTFSFYRTSPEVIYTNDTFGVVSNGKVMNLTGDSIQIRIIRTNVAIPAGWETCMCDIVQCHPPGMDTATADYPPGLSNIDVMLWAHSIPGTGYVTFRAEKVSNTNENYTVTFGGCYSPLGIQQISSIIKDFSLGQNYPNPFNPITKINFSTPISGYVLLIVYDILGKEVKTLVNEALTAGEYEVDFEATGLTSGMYYYTLRAGVYIAVKKMMFIK